MIRGQLTAARKKRVPTNTSNRYRQKVVRNAYHEFITGWTGRGMSFKDASQAGKIYKQTKNADEVFKFARSKGISVDHTHG
jgi:hypothetical protein